MFNRNELIVDASTIKSLDVCFKYESIRLINIIIDLSIFIVLFKEIIIFLLMYSKFLISMVVRFSVLITVFFPYAVKQYERRMLKKQYQ